MCCSLKGGSLLLLSVNLIVSAYFLVCTGYDIVGEQNHTNYSTRTEPEEVLLVAKDDLSQLESELWKPKDPPLKEPVKGYGLYWQLMKHVGDWYYAETFQIIKILILVCSGFNVFSSIMAIFSILLHSDWCSCWCCHPTPLIFVEGGSSMLELLLLVMVVLSFKERAYMSVQDVVGILIFMAYVFFFAYVISKYYKEEKDRMEEKINEDFERCALEEDFHEVAAMFPEVEKTLIKEMLDESGSIDDTVDTLLQVVGDNDVEATTTTPTAPSAHYNNSY